MFVAPVVVHLSRLVTDRGKEPATEDDDAGAISKVEEEEEDTKKQVRFDVRSQVDVKIGGTDPFNAFELPQDRTTDLALHHWIHVFQNTRMPTNPRQPWMSINLSDQTLLSVTVYCSINHFFFIRGQRCPQAYLPRKLHAIQNINKELQRLPSDHAVVAVAVMTLLECLGGEPAEWVVHRQGLQLMIRSRGGLEKLGLNGSVQRVISWADTCCAILLRTKPSLHPNLIPNALEPAIPGFSIGNLAERLEPLTSSSHLTSGIIYIYLRLRYLSQFLLSIPTSTLTTSSSSCATILDESFFSDKIDLIERAILALLCSASLAESRVAAFLTALLNAALIFVYEDLREVPKWNNVSILLSQRIKSGLELVELEGVIQWCPDLLLWTLMLGMSGANPLEIGARTWFVREIMQVEGMLQMEGKVPKGLKGIEGIMYFELAESTITKLSSGVVSNIDEDVEDDGG
ncbi:hypothetical protein N431DRAFT_499185 [Stipitochalara longipes BDJ]|nr:hypothetical protein N431DRAFT_499185 [Stipitochalara longipes BDJ]